MAVFGALCVCYSLPLCVHNMCMRGYELGFASICVFAMHLIHRDTTQRRYVTLVWCGERSRQKTPKRNASGNII